MCQTCNSHDHASDDCQNKSAASCMPVDEALKFADEWTEGHTFYEGSQGWRAVCAVLASEVRRLKAGVDCDKQCSKDEDAKEEYDCASCPGKSSSGIPDIMFDGHLVYRSMTERMRERTSADSVSDVLDTIVMLLRIEQRKAGIKSERPL